MFTTLKKKFLLGLYLWEHSIYFSLERNNFPSIDCILSFKRILPFLETAILAPLDYSQYEMETYFPTMESLISLLVSINAELRHSGTITAVNVQQKSTTGLRWLTSPSGRTGSDYNQELVKELSALIVLFESNAELKNRRLNGLLYRLASDLNKWLLLSKNAL